MLHSSDKRGSPVVQDLFSVYRDALTSASSPGADPPLETTQTQPVSPKSSPRLKFSPKRRVRIVKIKNFKLPVHGLFYGPWSKERYEEMDRQQQQQQPGAEPQPEPQPGAASTGETGRPKHAATHAACSFAHNCSIAELLLVLSSSQVTIEIKTTWFAVFAAAKHA